MAPSGARRCGDKGRNAKTGVPSFNQKGSGEEPTEKPPGGLKMEIQTSRKIRKSASKVDFLDLSRFEDTVVWGLMSAIRISNFYLPAIDINPSIFTH